MLTKPLPQQLISRLWLIFFALSPLACLGGIALLLRYDPNARAGLHYDRAEAIAIAQNFARSRGLDVTGWAGYCRIQKDDGRYFYYRIRKDRDIEDARRFAPEVTTRVLLVHPGRIENLEVEIAPDGRVIAFTHHSGAAEDKDSGLEVTQRIAQEAFQKRQSSGLAPSISVTPTVRDERNKSEGRIRYFAYAWPIPSLPEIQRELVISVRGDTVEGERVETKIDPKFAQAQLGTSKTSTIIFGIFYGLIVTIMVIFGVYRFAQRAQQKEVSYGRSILLAIVSAAIFIIFIFLTDVASYEQARSLQSNAPIWIGVLFGSIVYILLGLFLGLAYASGEGDIREAYPGKLTSLDALLLGRPFSRNVARAIIVGFAFGAWTLLLTQAVLAVWAQWPQYGAQMASLDMLMGRYPVFLTLYGWATFSVLAVIVGILLPLPFVLRRVHNPRWQRLLLFICAWFACMLAGLEIRPWAATLIVTIFFSIALLVSFFKYDLLTAVVAIGSLSLIESVSHLLFQPSASLRQSGIMAASIVLAVVIAAIFLAFRGREIQEDEVRPRYAAHLAERLSLQAEASAAREAQVRLMPQTLPKVSGLSLAAACRPAHEVGGDFYDFFEIEPGKIGIFVAEGGGRGLASALDIAFAKGFLMPKISGTASSNSGRDTSPTEIIRALQSRLIRIMPNEERTSFVYAVIDTTDGTLRYARFGHYPIVAVGKIESSTKAQLPQEREIRFRSGNDEEAETISITEGICYLEPGDTIMLMTDGIAKAWEREDKYAADALWHEFSENHIEATKLHTRLDESLDSLMAESSRQAARLGVEDDLTTVMVRVEDLSTPFSSLSAKEEEES